jgi:hypothetical protein
MNKRIKELAEQALQLVADEHTNGDESRLNTDSYHVKDLIQEKFAELIVRECARVASDRVMDVEGNDWGVRWAIKNHFGVEQ